MARIPLAQKIKVVKASVPAVTAIGAVAPVEVNGTGYDRCMWIISFGAGGAGASTCSGKIQDAATTGGALVDITSAASAGYTKAGHASTVNVIDHAVNSARPFMKFTGTVATDTLATCVTAILYNGRNFPVATAYATEFIQVV